MTGIKTKTASQQEEQQPLISLLLPTRGRPAQARRFLDSVAQTTANSSRIEVILRVDEDDAGSRDISHPGLTVRRMIGPRLTMGAYNSLCLEHSSGDIIILANDDVVLRAAGWDDEIRKLHLRHGDGVYLAYPNDLYKGEKLCAFPILSRATCDLLTEPFPRAYKGSFIDVHLLDIFKRLRHRGHSRIFYLENIIFEHMHFRAGKAKHDETYASRGRFEDDATFLNLKEARQAAADCLLSQIETGAARKCEVNSQGGRRIPQNLLQACLFFAVFLGGDHGLPLKWRLYLIYWFCGRRLVSTLTGRQHQPPSAA